MNRVNIKIKVRAKDPSKLPDWGLGPGILAEQEIVLGEELTEKNKIRFHLMIDEIYQELLNSTLEKIIEPIVEEI